MILVIGYLLDFLPFNLFLRLENMLKNKILGVMAPLKSKPHIMLENLREEPTIYTGILNVPSRRTQNNFWIKDHLKAQSANI